jgi:uncharacterized protein
MLNVVKALRSLQEIDRDLYRVRDELRRLPAERDRRQAELDAHQTRIDAEQEAVNQLHLRAKELEDTSTVQRQRIRKLEKESMEQRDVSVIEACRYEARSLKRQVEEAERATLEMMERIESMNTSIGEKQAKLAEERATFEEFSKNVDAELGEAQGRHDTLAGQRDEHLGGELPRETLALYDRLIEARGGEAMAMLDGGVCQGCYMSVPPNLVVRLARAREVTQCPSCDRILYLG